MNSWNPVGGRSLACTLVAVLMLFWPVWAAERHSGTIVSINKTVSAIVVGEVGPWRVRRGQTEVMKPHVPRDRRNDVRARRAPH